MRYLFVYDSSKKTEIETIVKVHPNIAIIKNALFWKLQYKHKVKHSDCLIVYKSSIKNSRNVQWEIRYLKSHDILIVVDDISQKMIVDSKAKLIWIANTDKLFEHIESEIKQIGLDGMFDKEMNADLAKEFMFKMLETSESLINRRQNTNNFMLTANGILITLIGVIFGIEKVRSVVFPLLLLPAIGIIICISCFSLLTSFGKLNKAKFEVICLLESRIGVPIFNAEWKYLSQKSVSYKSFTKTERWLPVLISIVYIAIAIIVMAINITAQEKGVPP
jgi:hypothetical protein